MTRLVWLCLALGQGFRGPAAPLAGQRRSPALRLAELPDVTESVTITLGDSDSTPIIIETGRLGRQAEAAVMTRRGDTMVYTTLCVGEDEEKGGDFCPMSVDYFERFSATGRTSGAYNKRDGRQGEKEILTSRLIDRPLRPTIIDGWAADIQIISWVVAFDGVHSPEVLAMLGCSAALQLSQVPTTCSVGASHVSIDPITREYILDGTIEQCEASPLSLVVSAAEDDILMVEGGANFESDEVMFEALKRAKESASSAGAQIATWAEAMREKGVGREKNPDLAKPFPVELKKSILESFSDKIRDSTLALRTGDMRLHRQTLSKLTKAVSLAFPDAASGDVKRALKKCCEDAMSDEVKEASLRCDGRPLTEVRPIDVDLHLLPSAHGSAVFTRGETQSMATCTLGDTSMTLRRDDALHMEVPNKRFYVQYNFPPSSVGETGRVGAPGRREIGHGALAERALLPALPDAADFPYAVRVESLITESCGSSSMATVCGGCLAMMDAGVPLKTIVAGVAMGVILFDDADAVVLTDILGVEDALGSMDFKVAGDADGISAFQLDCKRRGLTLEILKTALEQARQGRLHILGKMTDSCSEPRASLASNVPRQRRVQVPAGLIGKIIGPRGANIKAMIEDLKLSNLDIQEDGTVTISAMTDEALEACEERLEVMKKEDEARGGSGPKAARAPYEGPMPTVNTVYSGTVESVKQFGAFISFAEFPGLEGLCHISELATDRVRNIDRFIAKGEKMDVKVLAIDEESKKLTLSRKAIFQDRKEAGAAASKPPAAAPAAAAE